MKEEEKTIDLLRQILAEQKKQTAELENIKNIFLKYDNEELMRDETLRMG